MMKTTRSAGLISMAALGLVALTLGSLAEPYWLDSIALTLPNIGQVALLTVVLAVSGFASGLTGFGFSAIGAASVWVMPPNQVIPLLMLLSLSNQAYSYALISQGGAAELKPQTQSFKERLRNAPSFPFIVGGFLGVPAGVWLLSNLPPKQMTLLIGVILLGYTLWAIVKPQTSAKPLAGSWGRLITGATGGLIGGFTAFPGSALVVWSGLQGLDKASQRKIVQPFIMAMQLVSLTFMAVGTSLISLDTLVLFALMCPFVLPATAAGVAAFRRFSDQKFNQAVLIMLGISGACMVLKAIT